ncbi:MAG: MotA/TolQ/ExbB proton channel family protein, partial [Candidatus Heimdallarchaeota archaeon]|nr:MotA/TolQ/ExbB proton channel family protein [Candidatus Heimdallarchaeota archaeon]
RTMGILFPMFGLLGTLLGIVEVLQNITQPERVTSSMAFALSSAFLGIFLSIASLIIIRKMAKKH